MYIQNFLTDRIHYFCFHLTIHCMSPEGRSGYTAALTGNYSFPPHPPHRLSYSRVGMLLLTGLNTVAPNLIYHRVGMLLLNGLNIVASNLIHHRVGILLLNGLNTVASNLIHHRVGMLLLNGQNTVAFQLVCHRGDLKAEQDIKLLNCFLLPPA